ncbi:2Fe-2S iron-sulfur cluster-binding protein [Desulfitobacterium chlororespirans]|uniref:2Fe-2S iron-sulfur cluster binding domain-containing protein n=1 Tax=Desulfitobacterium chlororespirans DSM 11544 TaxID=1121395 RepID=A0A1M7SI39_9FIRM|nr:2Fe-2S iron-sulfur cluster-binding protein [Desulfitobacterium chlororespirans]SHN58110.1 2Fe-2S iron-sulfur cluster binding domain-containing protein [Desulfitobacterium chlororespirans DSM 11544]
MAPRITIQVDGKQLEADENGVLLTVLVDNGFTVPALCYHPRLGGHSRCSLCIVEVNQGGQWETRHACELYCRAGLQVRTDSPGILNKRAWAAWLLLQRGPFPDTALENMLRQIARGKDLAPPGTNPPGLGTKAQPGCILCGRCIAVCQKTGRNHLTFLGRGKKLRISFVGSRSHPEGCGECKACRQFCPTGYIQTNGESAFSAKLY